MTHYGAVVRYKFPGVSYAVQDDGHFVYWAGESDPPTVKQMDELWPEVEALLRNDEVRLLRRRAYKREADPLYMEWQAGERSESDWLAKREEIKRRFPFVSVPN